MGTIMMLIGAGMLLGCGVLLYVFFAHSGSKPPQGVSRLELADFPHVAGLFEGFMMFAFGAFLFIFGLAWLLSGGAAG